MSDLQRAWSKLSAESSIWAMSPAQMTLLATRVAQGAEYQAAESLVAERRRFGTIVPQGVALVPIIGPIFRRGGGLTEAFGFTSYDQIQDRIWRAVHSTSVEQIMLLVDSPGGNAQGCEETASAIAAAASRKPVVAFVDGLMCSAALWLGAQAKVVVATPSSEIGSLGVYALHLNFEEQLRKEGISARFIVSNVSPRKVDGNELEKPSLEFLAKAQKDVDVIADRFVSSVARARRVTPAMAAIKFGRGETMYSDAAKAAGLIDYVGDIEHAMRLAILPASHRAAQLAEARERLAVSRRAELAASDTNSESERDRRRRLLAKYKAEAEAYEQREQRRLERP